MSMLGKIFFFVLRRSIKVVCIFILITFFPWFPPNVKITYQTLTPIKLVDSVMKENVLSNVEYLFTDKIIGPECFVEYKGNLYTGIRGGEVIKISPQHEITSVVKFGKPCTSKYKEDICGRPLGMKIVKDDLYVADVYYGIWKYNLINGQKEQLVSPDETVDGVVPKFFNNLDVASNGDVFWSHSSSDFQVTDMLFVTFADASGRLIHYNANEKTNTVLLTDLWFANGVALSPNEDFVIVAQSVISQIDRYYLKGPKKGQKDIFIDGLPGCPDNLQVLRDGSGFTVPMYFSVIEPYHPMPGRILAYLPMVRKFLLRVMYMAKQTLKTIEQWFPNNVLEKLEYSIGTFTSMALFVPKGVYVCRIDWNGNLLEIWYGDDSIEALSDAFAFNGKLYLGSPQNNYLGVVNLPTYLKAQEQLKINASKIDMPEVKDTKKSPGATVEMDGFKNVPNTNPGNMNNIEL